MNEELKDVSDFELIVRLGILYKLVYDGHTDPRVINPLNQMNVLLQELIARKSQPFDQVVQLSSLNLHGELIHPGQ